MNPDPRTIYLVEVYADGYRILNTYETYPSALSGFFGYRDAHSTQRKKVPATLSLYEVSLDTTVTGLLLQQEKID